MLSFPIMSITEELLKAAIESSHLQTTDAQLVSFHIKNMQIPSSIKAGQTQTWYNFAYEPTLLEGHK